MVAAGTAVGAGAAAFGAAVGAGAGAAGAAGAAQAASVVRMITATTPSAQHRWRGRTGRRRAFAARAQIARHPVEGRQDAEVAAEAAVIARPAVRKAAGIADTSRTAADHGQRGDARG